MAIIGRLASRRRLFYGTAVSALSTGLLFAPPAHANNECGDPIGGDPVICDNDGVPAGDTNPYPQGISYVTADGIEIILDGRDNPLNIVVAEDNVIRFGVRNETQNTAATFGPIIRTLGDVSITTTERDDTALYALTSGAGTIVIDSGATISTAGQEAHAIHALSRRIADIDIERTIWSRCSKLCAAADRVCPIDAGNCVRPFPQGLACALASSPFALAQKTLPTRELFFPKLTSLMMRALRAPRRFGGRYAYSPPSRRKEKP